MSDNIMYSIILSIGLIGVIFLLGITIPKCSERRSRDVLKCLELNKSSECGRLQ